MFESFPIHFIRPLWLLALPLAILLPYWWKRLRGAGGDWHKVCDPHLLNWLSGGKDASAGTGKRGSVFAALTIAIVALALSGPSWERLPDSSFSSRDARVLVLDLSRSMLAEDLKPSRLIQARFRLSDILQSTDEGQMGLVAYAGDAFVVSPLTNDMQTVENLLPALQPDIIPVSGSRPDRGLALAASLLERAGLNRGEILLVTDSVDNRAVEMAAELADQGIVTSVLSVGTAAGAPIPSGNGFLSDNSGNVVIARVDIDGLRNLARAGDGHFSELNSSSRDVLPWKEKDGSEFGLRDDALGERWNDSGVWLVLLLLPLVLLAFRRGVLFVLPLMMLPFYSQPAEAGWWEDLWQRRDQQAHQAIQQEQYDEAATLAESPDLAGEALYRQGEYARAMESWLRQDTADAHYNRGNALAQMGELDGAIEAYNLALARDPEMEDALVNKALLEQMKQQEQEQQQSEDQNEESSDSQQQDSEQQGESEEQSEEEQQSEQQESEESESEQQSQEQAEMDQEEIWSEEDAQAMEQWLRRIPDDPGGLLRRKFKNEYQRRGAPEDEGQPW